MYTTRICPYCVAAKNLLRSKGVPFEEVDISGNHEARVWLAQNSGQRTVPQIFFGERSIGGFQELASLDRDGSLMGLVADLVSE